jgi:hypothetical protein
LKSKKRLSHRATKDTEINRQKFSEKSQRKNPFSKGFVSVRARREGKNKLDDFLRALRFFVVIKFPTPSGRDLRLCAGVYPGSSKDIGMPL